jgi:hypothetical protein
LPTKAYGSGSTSIAQLPEQEHRFILLTENYVGKAETKTNEGQPVGRRELKTFGQKCGQ